jgi:hypothetical protein
MTPLTQAPDPAADLRAALEEAIRWPGGPILQRAQARWRTTAYTYDRRDESGYGIQRLRVARPVDLSGWSEAEKRAAWGDR